MKCCHALTSYLKTSNGIRVRNKRLASYGLSSFDVFATRPPKGGPAETMAVTPNCPPLQTAVVFLPPHRITKSSTSTIIIIIIIIIKVGSVPFPLLAIPLSSFSISGSHPCAMKLIASCKALAAFIFRFDSWSTRIYVG